MNKLTKTILSFSILLFLQAFPALADDDTPPVIAEWEQFWNTYDLDQMDKLFIKSDELTYFSSEFQGLIRGYDAMVEHHKGFGFIPGGDERSAKLWLEKIETDYVGDTAVVTAIWYFDTVRDGKKVLMDGPVSFVCTKDSSNKFKLQHVHFANY